MNCSWIFSNASSILCSGLFFVGVGGLFFCLLGFFLIFVSLGKELMFIKWGKRPIVPNYDSLKSVKPVTVKLLTYKIAQNQNPGTNKLVY